MFCRKCKQSLKRLMLLAMLTDAGAKCSPGALTCTADGGEHDFAEEAPLGVIVIMFANTA